MGPTGVRLIEVEFLAGFDTLVVEAQISVDAIDDVHIGQDADVRLSAYARRTTPLVYGTVSYVSADRMTSPDERSFWYVVRIDITRQALLEAGDLKMYPGMPAEIFIKTGERTVLDYMLTPFANTMHRALREP